MLTVLLFSVMLVVITVAVHAFGFSGLLRAIMRSHALNLSGFLPLTRLMIVLACGLMLIHLTEIGVWGMFYFWQGCMQDVSSALYFSAGTYTTIGAGGLMLPTRLRMIAPLETLTGMLMCGLSTGLFFALLNQWIINWMQRQTVVEPMKQ